VTIATQSSRNDYTGDGSTKAFPFTFTADASTDVTVYVAQTLVTTGYTVTGTFPGTGTLTFTIAPISGAAVALVRATPYTQAVDLIENDPMAAATIERAFDKVTILAQQALEFATRGIRLVAGSVRAVTGLTMAEPIANKYLKINATCDGIELVALTVAGTYADPVTTKGDLIQGSATGAQERLGIGTGGQGLMVDPFYTRAAWMPGWLAWFTNKVDAALTAGDVVGISTACDRAVSLEDVSGCGKVFAVAPAAVGDDCSALFQIAGVAQNVKAQGTILRGDWVRKSATTKAVESTAVGSNCDRMIPAGTLGVALTTATGGFVDLLLFGRTHHQVPVLDQLTGLGLSNNGADATNDIDIALGAAASDDAGIANREILSLTAALTKRLDAGWSVGTNQGGLDTGAVGNGVYHIFVIKNPTSQSVDALFSLSATAPTLPSGYTKQRRIGTIIRAGATILLFDQFGDEFWLDAALIEIANAVPIAGATTITLAGVPTGVAMQAILNIELSPASTTQNGILLSALATTAATPTLNTTAPLATLIGGTTTALAAFMCGAQARVWTNTSAQIRHQAVAASGTWSLATLGWVDRRGRA
jgi:hypothetical protein